MTAPGTVAAAPASSLDWIDDFGMQRERSAVAVPVDPINPFLIGLALVYVAWSYFSLASSIWVRALFACYLILRMKPDIIIPYCLSCLQLRLSLSAGAADYLDQGLSDVYQNLTGFESYAFSLPPLLFAARALFAIVTGKVNWRHFPLGLYLLWGLGGMFVVAAALYARAAGQGWTAGMRMYCIVGTVFYGLLLPRLTQQQMNRLAGGLALIAFILVSLAVLGMFGSQLLFVLGPVAVGWSMSGLLTRTRVVYSAFLLSLCTLHALAYGTLMMRMNWFWSLVAAVVEVGVAASRGRQRVAIPLMVLCTIVACQMLFISGIVLHSTEKMEQDGTLLGRVQYKLYGDRGPIWAGALKFLIEDPTLMPIPGQPFLINSHGQELLWRFGPHNLALEAFRQLGVIAGPIALLVLFYTVVQSTIVISGVASRGSMVLASAAICNIVVGGTTLPYVLGDRQGEVILLAAGLVVASCWSLAPAARAAVNVTAGTAVPALAEEPVS